MSRVYAPTASTGGATNGNLEGCAVAATSKGGVQVTGGASHTKGSWVELIASSAFSAETIVITNVESIAAAGVNTCILLDIGIGAGGAETVLIANLGIGWVNLSGPTFILPLAIAAGTRISARLQGAVASETATIGVQLRGAGDHSTAPTAATTYGADTATSNGVALTSAGAINTEAAWTEITASTSADARALLVILQNLSTTSVISGEGLVDIATGAGGAETLIIGDISFQTNSSEIIIFRNAELAFTKAITSGTRLSARYQATNTSARPTVSLVGVN